MFHPVLVLSDKSIKKNDVANALSALIIPIIWPMTHRYGQITHPSEKMP